MFKKMVDRVLRFSRVREFEIEVIEVINTSRVSCRRSHYRAERISGNGSFQKTKRQNSPSCCFVVALLIILDLHFQTSFIIMFLLFAVIVAVYSCGSFSLTHYSILFSKFSNCFDVSVYQFYI